MKFLFQDPKTKNYSRKSVYAFLSFFVASFLSVLAMFREKTETALTVQLVTLFAMMFLTLMGFTIWNKIIENKKNENND